MHYGDQYRDGKRGEMREQNQQTRGARRSEYLFGINLEAIAIISE